MQHTISHPLFNRLKKNAKQLKPFLQQNTITCYRAFDWDMPEFPLCIDVYEGRIHVAEYKTKHGLHDDAYELWKNECVEIIKQFFNVEDDALFFKITKKKQSI
jgi:23S rRNA (cytosine1962-C5)-methyltransferase